MLNILEDGTKEDLGNGYYKILFNWPRINQPKAFFTDRLGSLSLECLTRPRLMQSILQAKKDGYFIVVSGRSGWHTLYKPYIDEYYGIQEWNKEAMMDHKNFIIKRIGTCDINRDFHHHNPCFEFEKYDLPKPSAKAMEIANEKLKQGKFVTVGAIKRNSFETKDFHDWPNLVKKLQELGFKVYATCPRAGGVYDLDCEHIEDLYGHVNLMDVEIAMHSLSSACLTSNTGIQGLMLYSNTDYVFNFKGDAGAYGCSWENMHNSLTKMSGYKTKLIRVEPIYGPDEKVTDNILQTMKKINLKP